MTPSPHLDEEIQVFFSYCVLKKILLLLLQVFGKHQRDEAVFARRGAGLFRSDFSLAERKVKKKKHVHPLAYAIFCILRKKKGKPKRAQSGEWPER